MKKSVQPSFWGVCKDFGLFRRPLFFFVLLTLTVFGTQKLHAQCTISPPGDPSPPGLLCGERAYCIEYAVPYCSGSGTTYTQGGSASIGSPCAVSYLMGISERVPSLEALFQDAIWKLQGDPTNFGTAVDNWVTAANAACGATLTVDATGIVQCTPERHFFTITTNLRAFFIETDNAFYSTFYVCDPVTGNAQAGATITNVGAGIWYVDRGMSGTTTLSFCANVVAPGTSGGATPPAVEFTWPTTGTQIWMPSTNPCQHLATWTGGFSGTSGTVTGSCEGCSLEITGIFPSACNPATNTYTVQVEIEYTSAISNSILVILTHPSFGVRTATIPVVPFSSTPPFSPVTVTILNAPANSAQCIDVSAFFVGSSCGDQITCAFDAPASCTSSCIVNVTGVTTTSCVPASNTYSAMVNVSWTNAVSSTITVTAGGQTGTISGITVGSSGSGSVTLNGLFASGGIVNGTAQFDAGCTTPFSFVAPASCAPGCSITLQIVDISDCDPIDNLYDLTFIVGWTNATGTSIPITVYDGPAGFGSPVIGTFTVTGITLGSSGSQTVTINNLPSDNIPAFHSILAQMTGCSGNTLSYMPPEECLSCLITINSVTAGPCDPNTNTHNVNVTYTFHNPPTTGVLRIYVAGGGWVVVNPPFLGAGFPNTISIPGQLSTGTTKTVYAVFTADLNCVDAVQYTSPPDCANCRNTTSTTND